MSRAQTEGHVWLRHLLGESMPHQMQCPQTIQNLHHRQFSHRYRNLPAVTATNHQGELPNIVVSVRSCNIQYKCELHDTTPAQQHTAAIQTTKACYGSYYANMPILPEVLRRLLPSSKVRLSHTLLLGQACAFYYRTIPTVRTDQSCLLMQDWQVLIAGFVSL